MKSISKKQNSEIVASVASSLQELVDEVVFVGGSSASFLIKDEDIVLLRHFAHTVPGTPRREPGVDGTTIEID